MLQDDINRCSVAVDLYAVDEQILSEKDKQLQLLTDTNATLGEQLDLYKQQTIELRAANADLTTALAEARQGNKDRDAEIALLKDRISKLENKHTSTWKKILFIAAGVVVGRGL